MSLSPAKARSSRLGGCPPEDPRDRIGAPQEIPQSLTRNTTHSSLRSHTAGPILCVFIWNVWTLFTVQRHSWEIFFVVLTWGGGRNFHMHSFPCRSTMRATHTADTSSTGSVISLVGTHHLAQCTVRCLFKYFPVPQWNCPCEKIIRLSWGLFLALVHVHLSDKHSTHKHTHRRNQHFHPQDLVEERGKCQYFQKFPLKCLIVEV